MKKKSELNNFVFDLRISGSRNGATVTAPFVNVRDTGSSLFLAEDVKNLNLLEVTMDSTVFTTKADILEAVSKALDAFYE